MFLRKRDSPTYVTTTGGWAEVRPFRRPLFPVLRKAMRRLMLPGRPAGDRQGADARHRRARRPRSGGEAAREGPIFLLRTRKALGERR